MVRAAERLNIPPKKWLRSRFCLFFFLAMPCGLKCPGGSDGKEFAFNSGVLGSIPGLGRSPRGQPGNPLQYSCLESPRGQRSLAGYSPWGHKELDTTEWLSMNTNSLARDWT